MAVLPFQNLTPDVSLDWMRAAAPAVLEGQLVSSRKVHVFPVQSMSDAYAGGATQVVHGSFVAATGDRVRLQVVVEDVDRLSASREYTAAARPVEFLGLMDGLARTLDSGAQPYSTRSVEALRALADGLQAADPAAAVRDLERALAADADFGPAYVALVQRLAAQGDSRARAVAGQGLSRRIDEVDHLRLEVLAASLSGDREGEAKAVEALAKALPADTRLLLRVAESAFRARRYAESEAAYRRAAAADPTQASTWNLLAYSQAYTGNLSGAMESLGKYRSLAPKDPNRADSQGDINLLFGRFSEAEKAYREAYALDRSFLGGGPLGKAAIARWLGGDPVAAGELEKQYLDVRRAAGDPLLPYRDAQWAYLTGRHREAIAKLRGALPGLKGDVAPLAGAELALWLLEAGDAAGARQIAADAVAQARSPQIQVLALTAKFAAAAANGREIGALVSRAIPQPGAIRDLVLVWALIFHGRFAEAEPLAAALEKQSIEEGAPRLAVLRAWLQVKSGRVNDAASAVEQYPLPAPSGEAPFSTLILPRWFFVKAMVLSGQGKRAEGEPLLRLYRQYAGDGTLAREDLAQWESAGAPAEAPSGG